MSNNSPGKGKTHPRERLAHEQGTVIKDWGGRLPVALIYPHSYYVGMSNLGMQTIYRLLNDYPEAVCERVFYEGDGIPPHSVESDRPLTDFAVLAFSVSYELDYFNIPRMLRSAGIPLYSAERDETHPLVIAGGPCVSANPLPLSPFCDAIGIGEAESLLPPVIPVLAEDIASRRCDLLQRLAGIPGFYVPQSPGQTVARQWARDLDEYRVTSAVLTPDTELGDLYMIEVERGCARACRFCLLCTAFRPMRMHSLDKILDYAREGLQYRRRIGLVGPAVADHPRIEEIMSRLVGMGAELAISSLRLNTLTPEILGHMGRGGIRTVTIAPEAGAARLREVIRKDITEEQVIEAAGSIAEEGMKQLKLYFMVGLPSETDEDIEEIVRLTRAIKDTVERRGRGTRITLNLSPFVPKAGTPFQWLGMAPVAVLNGRITLVQRKLVPEGIKANVDSPAWSEVQAVLARGDERLAGVLAEMESTSLAAWRSTTRQHHIDTEFSAHQAWPVNQKLPWGFIDTGVSHNRLKSELEAALAIA